MVIFLFLLSLGMVMYANEVATIENEKLPEIKNNYNIYITCLLSLLILYLLIFCCLFVPTGE